MRTRAEHRWVRAALLLVAGLFLALPESQAAPPAAPRIRNLIVMISDGAGENTVEATRLWSGKPLAVDDKAFTRVWKSNYPLDRRNVPTPGPAGADQVADDVYVSARAWDSARAPEKRACPSGMPTGFAGYDWHCATYPDSANTMTAMMSGVRSYNNAINVDGRGTPVPTVAEAAVAAGREAGIVTTAQLSDATPAAGGGAHNVSRLQRREIAAEMFSRGLLSVIIGAGNPDYDNDGRGPVEAPIYEWIGEDLWTDLKNGTNASGRNAPDWVLVRDKEALAPIVSGEFAMPEKLAYVLHAQDGAEQYRGGGLKPGTDEPFATPLLGVDPTLAELSRVALQRLDQKDGGFFLMIEESNTDRAAHANNLGRVIEARLSFEDTVRAVVQWVDSPDSKATWADTLLVITADHDHLLFGPDADAAGGRPFQPVQPNAAGPGHLPRHKWFSNSHSNQLVPVWVRGAGAKQFAALATATDRYCDTQKRCFGHGAYLDQAAMGAFLRREMSRR